MFTEELYERNILCGCFHFICLLLLISIMKRRAERCALQLHQTSLRETSENENKKKQANMYIAQEPFSKI